MSLFDEMAAGNAVESLDELEEGGSICAAEESLDDLENGGSIGPAVAIAECDEEIPDFLRNMHKVENSPLPGETAWFITKGTKKPVFIENQDGLRFEAATDKALCAGLLLAEGRGWIPVKLDGTPRFCSMAFIEACKLGIPVSGYLPTESDLKALKKIEVEIPTVKDYKEDLAAHKRSMGMGV